MDVKIVSNNVNVNEAGTYEVVYSATNEVDTVTYTLTVIVKEAELSATLTYGEEKYTGQLSHQESHDIFISTYDNVEGIVTSYNAYWTQGNNALRLGTTSNIGYITYEFASNIRISKVIVVASQYDGAVSIKIGDQVVKVINDERSVEFTVSDISEFTLEVVSTSKSRVQIHSVTIEYIVEDRPFYIDGVKEVAFYAKQNSNFTPELNIVLNYGNEPDVTNDFDVLDLETVGIYYINFSLENSDGYIKDYRFVLYVIEDENELEGYPEMDEEKLRLMKSVFDNDRGKLQVKYPNYNEQTYYSNLDDSSSSALISSLYTLLSSVNQVTYDEVRFILEESDMIETPWGPYLHGIYDSKKLVRYWDGGATIDREHVWPQSYLTVKAGDFSRSMATDVHNLRAILNTTNSSRSNRYFTSGSSELNHTIGNDAYYPGDDHRGDVARIMFYMHVRYKDELFLTDSINDIVTYKVNGTTINGKIPFGLLSKLLEWHELDPVDDFERYRNDIIYKYQGNRNPFIDHEEYVAIIFGVEQTNEFIVIYAEVFINVEVNLSDLKPRFEELLVN